MAGDSTFIQMWRFLKLYAPDIPIPLLQEFVNNAYLRALRSYTWSGLLGEYEFNTPAAKTTGTVSVTEGSATVTAATAGMFTSADVGTQIQINAKGPYYTIIAVVDYSAGPPLIPHTITLDRAYNFPTNAAATYIQGRFLAKMPTDFGEVIAFRNVTNNWRLRGGIPVERVNAADAQRIAAGQPYIYMGTTPDPTTLVARFELWPKATGVRNYSVLYSKKPALLGASASIIEPLNGEVIKEGALAAICRWPGTSKLRNPMYNMADHKVHEELFKSGLAECWVQDQARNQTMISYAEWEACPYAPMDATFLQSTLVF